MEQYVYIVIEGNNIKEAILFFTINDAIDFFMFRVNRHENIKLKVNKIDSLTIKSRVNIEGFYTYEFLVTSDFNIEQKNYTNLSIYKKLVERLPLPNQTV